MKLLERLRHLGGTVQAEATQRAEWELQAELGKVEKQISAGEGDIAAALETRENLNREIEAVKIKTAKAKKAAFQAGITAQRETYIRKIELERAQLWRTLPPLRWALTTLAMLERDAVSGYDRASWGSLTGLRPGAADRLSSAIAQELRGTVYQDHISREPETSPPEVYEPVEGVTLRTPRTIATTRVPNGGGFIEYFGDPPAA